MSETDNGKPTLTSEEVLIIVLAFVLGQIQNVYGVSGVSADQIYAVGLFVVGLVRIFWTKAPINWKKLL